MKVTTTTTPPDVATTSMDHQNDDDKPLHPLHQKHPSSNLLVHRSFMIISNNKNDRDHHEEKEPSTDWTIQSSSDDPCSVRRSHRRSESFSSPLSPDQSPPKSDFQIIDHHSVIGDHHQLPQQEQWKQQREQEQLCKGDLNFSLSSSSSSMSTSDLSSPSLLSILGEWMKKNTHIGGAGSHNNATTTATTGTNTFAVSGEEEEEEEEWMMKLSTRSFGGGDEKQNSNSSNSCSSPFESQTFSIETEESIEYEEEELPLGSEDLDHEENQEEISSREMVTCFREDSLQSIKKEVQSTRRIEKRRTVERIFRDDPCGNVVEESEELLRSGFSKFGSLLRLLKELMYEAKEQLMHEWDENGRYLFNYYYQQLASSSEEELNPSHLSKLFRAVTPQTIQPLIFGLVNITNRLLSLKTTAITNNSHDLSILSNSSNKFHTNNPHSFALVRQKRHHIKELPREILENIFSFLFQKGGISNKFSSTSMNSLCEEDFLSPFARANIFSVLLTCREWYEVVTESTQFWRERVIRLSFHLKRKESHDMNSASLLFENGTTFRLQSSQQQFQKSQQCQKPQQPQEIQKSRRKVTFALSPSTLNHGNHLESSFVNSPPNSIMRKVHMMTCNPHQQDPPLTHISVHSQKKALLDETLLDLDLKMKRFHTDHPKRAKQFYFFYWLSLLRQVQEQQARKHENSILQVSSLFHDEDDDDIETTATAQVSSQQQASGGVLTTTNRMMMHHQRNAFLSSRLRFQNGVEIVFVLIVGLFFVWQWLGLLVFGGIFSKSNSRSGRGGNKIVSSHKRRLIH